MEDNTCKKKEPEPLCIYIFCSLLFFFLFFLSLWLLRNRSIHFFTYIHRWNLNKELHHRICHIMKTNDKRKMSSTYALHYISITIERSIYIVNNQWKELSYWLLITIFQSNIGMLFFSACSLYVVSAKVKWVNEWMSDKKQGLLFSSNTMM
jgi:hypothetical protein